MLAHEQRSQKEFASHCEYFWGNMLRSGECEVEQKVGARVLSIKLSEQMRRCENLNVCAQSLDHTEERDCQSVSGQDSVVEHYDRLQGWECAQQCVHGGCPRPYEQGTVGSSTKL